ncbi:MAG: hypothetical protein JWM42_1858, partial [Burkholderia sp.]|nr:hypothetical protein [Burkholderia sp.]
MASETPHPPTRRGRRIGIAFAVLATGVALLVAATGWLLMTGSGARAAFSLLDSVAPDVVRAEGIQGSLAGPLRIARLTIDTPGQKVTLENTQLDWRPRALLDRQLHVNQLHVERLGVVAKEQKEKEPAQLPESISLPFRL